MYQGASELVMKLFLYMKKRLASTWNHLQSVELTQRNSRTWLHSGPVFPGEADVIHQPDEHVEVEKLLRALQITAAAMYELAKK